MELSGQDGLYIFRILGHISGATEYRQFGGRSSQLFKVIREEGKQLLLTSGLESSFDKIQG